MNGFYTILLLLASNVFMILAWYGHLKLQQTGFFTNATPLIFVILLSWGIAFFEYCLQVPANRIGFEGNGGPFTPGDPRGDYLSGVCDLQRHCVPYAATVESCRGMCAAGRSCVFYFWI